MKKLIKIMAIIMVLGLVFVACSKTTKEDKEETTEKEQMVEDDKMTEDEDDKMMENEDDKMMEDEEDKMMENEDDKMMEDEDEDDKMTENEEDKMMEDEEDKMMENEDDKMMEEQMMNEGERAPEFSLLDLDGNTHTLADYHGEKVYIKYWASWCSICLAGIEEIDTLAGEAKDFKVITIVTPDYKGEKESEDFIEWFEGLETENITVLLDEKGVYAKEFGVRAYPTSAYIGSDGVLIKVLPGHVSSELITESFETIY